MNGLLNFHCLLRNYQHFIIPYYTYFKKIFKVKFNVTNCLVTKYISMGKLFDLMIKFMFV